MTAQISAVSPAADVARQGHIGLVVVGAIGSGFALGVVLVLGVLAGAEEATITGAALLALGIGFAALAQVSTLLTDQPQRWALIPGLAAAAAGIAMLGSRPADASSSSRAGSGLRSC